MDLIAAVNKKIRRGIGHLPAVVRGLDGQPVVVAGTGRDLRYLYIEDDVPLVLAEAQGTQANQQDLPQDFRVGRSDSVRDGRGYADPDLLLRDVRDSDADCRLNRNLKQMTRNLFF